MGTSSKTYYNEQTKHIKTFSDALRMVRLQDTRDLKAGVDTTHSPTPVRLVMG